jgi:GxxExxY protein
MFEEDKLTHKIIGCAMNVHNAIGCGFQEVIYQRCLALEMEKQGLHFDREKEMEIHYQGEMVGTRRIDFLVEGSVIVELKALKELEDVHLVQGKNYLKVFNIEKGLLLNLGATSLEFKRLFK